MRRYLSHLVSLEPKVRKGADMRVSIGRRIVLIEYADGRDVVLNKNHPYARRLMDIMT